MSQTGGSAVEVLTATKTLEQLEAVIERGLEAWQEVSDALIEIQEGRLYRRYGYETFDDYLRDRWPQLKRSQIYNYIAASRVAENVQSIGHSAPNLTQAIRLAPLPAEQQREIAERVDFANTTVRELKAIVQEAQQPKPAPMAVHFSSDSDEWYTPPEIIERTVRLFGQIDLDPCSNSREQPNVPAEFCYVREDDGLAQNWGGRVYMNPPYGRVIGEWTSKLLSEYKAGRVSEAIALVPARVDTDWFRRLRDCAVCFIDGRLRFSGMDNSAPFPSAVVYFGKNIAAFSAAFGDMGDVWVRWNKGDERVS